ncbi:MAG: hypothetical protein DMG57_20210 [Acidobacteria bacterium]|nr:MAG: hypothetical protein DMG57_20210 [Acidobacteriota bacterium]
MSGVGCGYLILSTSLNGASLLKRVSVKIWGFRGPLGAFIAAWGGIAMITSAPFDDWWHGAYGLDVKIMSPPHVLLIAGMVAVEFGTLVLILGQMNRAVGKAKEKLDWLFLYVGAMIVVCICILIFEYTLRIYMHSGYFYRVVAIAIPGVLAGVAKASGRRWAATTVIGIYSVFLIGCLWILPLVSAQPKLGPVYQPVTHLIPPEFPLLLIVPAVALDWFWARSKTWKPWLVAAVSGLIFVTLFAAVQWPFATFLLSPLSRNWAFGTMYFDYNLPSTSHYVRNVFYGLEKTTPQFWAEMAMALAAAILTTRIGMGWGDWMRRIRR